MVVKGIINHLSALIHRYVSSYVLPTSLTAISSMATVERADAEGRYFISALATGCKMYEPSPIDENTRYGGPHRPATTIEWYHLHKAQNMVVASEGPQAILRVGGQSGRAVQVK